MHMPGHVQARCWQTNVLFHIQSYATSHLIARIRSTRSAGLTLWVICCGPSTISVPATKMQNMLSSTMRLTRATAGQMCCTTWTDARSTSILTSHLHKLQQELHQYKQQKSTTNVLHMPFCCSCSRSAVLSRLQTRTQQDWTSPRRPCQADASSRSR
jgi:hypothetical protein